MGRRVRLSVLVVVVALGALPMVLMAAPAGAVTESVSTVEEYWDAWLDTSVTQIDLENDIDLYTDADYPNGDYSECIGGGGHYPERHDGDIVVDGHGFTLTMLCSPNAVIYADGTYDVTVRNITLTHAGAPTPTALGNGIAMSAGGNVRVENSTITGNWASDDPSCDPVGDVSVANLCVAGGGGIYSNDDVLVVDSVISNNRAPGQGGGIYAGGVVTITDSVVTDNWATDADDLYNLGGGVLAWDGAIVRGTEFRGNGVGCEVECYAYGGGLLANGAEIVDSVFVDNIAGCEEACNNRGGGIYVGGGATITRTTVSGNNVNCATDCQAQGGGVLISPTALTPPVPAEVEVTPTADPGTVTVTDSSFIGNEAMATSGDAFCFCEGGGLIAFDQSSMRIVGSTFADNTVVFDGAAIGIGDTDAPVEIVNSTVTGNTSSEGAIVVEGGVTVAYSTITDNVLVPVEAPTAAAGTPGIGAAPADDVQAAGEVQAAATEFGAALSLGGLLRSFATVVTGSVGGPNCLIFAGTSTSDGWNVSDDETCAFTNAAKGDVQQAGFAPQLGALGNNGGPTLTQLPAPFSPLVDAIPIADCQAGPAAGITDDQRHVTRPQMLGCDIGSVELEAPPAIQPTFTG